MSDYEASREVVRAVLPDGTDLLIAARQGSGLADRGGRVGQVFGLGGVQKSISGAIELVRGAVQQARPAELTVEFGFDVALESDGLIGMVTGVGGQATFTVTAVWRSEPGDTAALRGSGTADESPADEEGPADDASAA